MIQGLCPQGQESGPCRNPAHLSGQMLQHSWGFPIKSPELFINYEFCLATIAKQHVFRKRHSKNLAVASGGMRERGSVGAWPSPACGQPLARPGWVSRSLVGAATSCVAWQSHVTPLDVRFSSGELGSSLKGFRQARELEPRTCDAAQALKCCGCVDRSSEGVPQLQRENDLVLP